ncbi:sensor histidine kinase [Anaeromyxobacter diazotrophicus]|uniref:sensor histidine kinase n=1 Tax=Anaeromyxobacter diazotrophicus TaxID=2590199 RepID=UPI00159183EC|nr:ATP-binding protein [Anaeromyxobacter diazotrophicus]
MLAAVARLSIPEFADWCVVDVVEGGDLRRVEVAYRNPIWVAMAEQVRRAAPPAGDPSRQTLLAGRSLLLADYTDEVAIAHGWTPALRALAREVGTRSLLIVPLVVHDSVVGVSTFVMTSDSGRRYAEEDLALGEELAQRAAAVVENARLHQELKRSEQRFRVALAHTHVSVFETDRDLRYSWIYNPMYGLRAEDLVGKVSPGVIRPDEAAHFEARKRAVLESGAPSRDEVRLTLDGVTHHCIVHMEALRGPSGDVTGVTGAATDVTDQKRVQEALADALAFRDRMLGILGHDLRNPVAAVRTAATLLLRREGLDDDTRELAAAIDWSGKRMLEMIASLLDFSETRFKGALPISRVPTDLHEVTRGVVEEILAANPARQIALVVKGDTRGRWDPARMAQVVSNLVGNAIVYGSPGEPVRVSLDGGADQLHLTVWNAGAPIPPELFSVLFEPFRRGASHGRGLGLGLYIVKQIVAAHGGDIDVHSTAEDGTSFAVRLPRRELVAQDAAFPP